MVAIEQAILNGSPIWINDFKRNGNDLFLNSGEKITNDFTCPECGGVLVPKMGDIKDHHFAHKTNSNCEYLGETILHKELEIAFKKINRFPIQEKMQVKGKTFWVSKSRDISFDTVFTERDSEYKEYVSKNKELFNGFKPDLIGFLDGFCFWIEIVVTSDICDKKRTFMSENKIPCISIHARNYDSYKRDNTLNIENLVLNFLNFPAKRTGGELKLVANFHYDYSYFVSESSKLNSSVCLYIDYREQVLKSISETKEAILKKFSDLEDFLIVGQAMINNNLPYNKLFDRVKSYIQKQVDELYSKFESLKAEVLNQASGLKLDIIYRASYNFSAGDAVAFFSLSNRVRDVTSKKDLFIDIQAKVLKNKIHYVDCFFNNRCSMDLLGYSISMSTFDFLFKTNPYQIALLIQSNFAIKELYSSAEFGGGVNCEFLENLFNLVGGGASFFDYSTRLTFGSKSFIRLCKEKGYDYHKTVEEISKSYFKISETNNKQLTIND